MSQHIDYMNYLNYFKKTSSIDKPMSFYQFIRANEDERIVNLRERMSLEQANDDYVRRNRAPEGCFLKTIREQSEEIESLKQRIEELESNEKYDTHPAERRQGWIEGKVVLFVSIALLILLIVSHIIKSILVS